MLNEQRATGIHYDTQADATHLSVGAAFSRTGAIAASLLLDRAGFLVGVDVDPDAATRRIVMLGPHEAVARTSSVSVVVNATGVTIASARALCRGDERNPYWSGEA
jgi:hypothetical protein